MSGATTTVDILLRLVPDSPERVITQLELHPELASAADSTGYSLLHAAASYKQLDLLRTLVKDYKVDVNIKDEDGETPLFVVESLDAAKCLVEELGADETVRNESDTTAEDHALEMMDEGEAGDFVLIADYFERRRTNGTAPADAIPSTTNGDIGDASIEPDEEHRSGLTIPQPPPNVRVTMGTMQELPDEGDTAPDPEFRRRIEELAAREDFQSEEGQRELRNLITDAVEDLASGVHEREVRPRTD